MQSSPDVPVVEQWRAIPGYSNYEASDLGRVRRIAGRGIVPGESRVLKPRTNNAGRLRVVLCQDEQRHDWLVHRLVLLAFVGSPPTPEHECDHKDFDTLNNRLENLEWVLPSENRRRFWQAARRGGSKRGRARATLNLVSYIRELARMGVRSEQIARKVGFTRRNIEMIVGRKTWRDAP